MARPSSYTPELGERICEAIATSSKGLHHLCKEHEDWPSVSTIMKWLIDNSHPEFSERYAHAREEQAEFMVEEILQIADDSSRDIKIIEKNGESFEVENTEFVNRSKLRVEARKWLAMKLKPKKYGDKLDITSKVTVEQPLFPDIIVSKKQDDENTNIA